MGGLPFCSILCHLSACAGLRKPFALCCSAHTGVWGDRFETTFALNNFLCTASLQKRSQKSEACLSASASLKSLLQVALDDHTPSAGSSRVECLSSSYSRNTDALSRGNVPWMLCMCVCVCVSSCLCHRLHPVLLNTS